MIWDRGLERKALWIMAAIGVAELFAIWAAVRNARPGLLQRLFVDGHPAGWLAALLVTWLFISLTIPDCRRSARICWTFAR